MVVVLFSVTAVSVLFSSFPPQEEKRKAQAYRGLIKILVVHVLKFLMVKKDL